MAKAYFGSRISTNMITTPEGYLVCKNVPVARTGTQQYRGCEFGADEPNKVYNVIRSESEVFDKAAIASFEGKPVCDEHPDTDVTPDNYSRYMKGVCRDVHRGEGDLKNCLVGDLIIYDAELIDKIKNGKREISCGYDCLWCQIDDSTFEQRDIRGNHIAVVDKGRAGHKVAIRDSAGRSKKMSKNIFARMLAAFAKDADTTPDDLLEASKAVATDAPKPVPQPTPAPTAAPVQNCEPKPTVDADLDARLTRIEDALADLANTKQQNVPAPEDEDDALDSLEELVNQKIGDEDDVTEDPEVINEKMGEDEEPEELEENEQPQINAASRDAAMRAIRNLKPVVAALPPNQRKRAADSLAALIREQVVADSQYGALQRAQRAHRANDKSLSDRDYGRYIRDKYNPHYTKEDK
jgi:hypothetical protein